MPPYLAWRKRERRALARAFNHRSEQIKGNDIKLLIGWHNRQREKMSRERERWEGDIRHDYHARITINDKTFFIWVRGAIVVAVVVVVVDWRVDLWERWPSQFHFCLFGRARDGAEMASRHVIPWSSSREEEEEEDEGYLKYHPGSIPSHSNSTVIAPVCISAAPARPGSDERQESHAYRARNNRNLIDIFPGRSIVVEWTWHSAAFLFFLPLMPFTRVENWLAAPCRAERKMNRATENISTNTNYPSCTQPGLCCAVPLCAVARAPGVYKVMCQPSYRNLTSCWLHLCPR